MITLSSGDLLAADVEAVVNTVNTVGVMGKGIALQFKRRYPENYALYREACARNEVQLGRMFTTETHEITGPRLIINFPTKGHWKARSRLSDVQEGLEDLKKVVLEHRVKSIAIPPLGAGNGGLDWMKVRAVIEEALRDLPELDVRLYEPQSSHRAVAGTAVRITPSRALLLGLVQAYQKRRDSLEPWEQAEGVSHLEIQKLMYFAERINPDLRLRFAQGHFGPYSDVVRHMVAEMEGTFLRGFGDGTDRTLDLSPILVTEAATEPLAVFNARDERAKLVRSTIESVMEAIDGFEGAYPLELLASVQWVADQTGSRTEQAVFEYMRSWNSRKGRIFTERHVSAALEHLAA